MKREIIIIALSAFLLIPVFAQEKPPTEIDNSLRASIQLFMGPDDVDFKEFVENRYAEDVKKSSDIESLVEKLKVIKLATKGAGGVDIAVDDNVFNIHFSEGNEATVAVIFDPKQVGKIYSIELLEQKDPSSMTETERFDAALISTIRKIESLSNLMSDDEYNKFIDEHFTSTYISKRSKAEIIEMLKSTSLVAASAMTIGSRPLESKEDNGVVLEMRGPRSADVSFTIEKSSPYLISWFELNEDVQVLEMDEDLIPMNWKNYKDKLAEEEEKGFSGVVYVVRDGKIVHAEGYGYANKEESVLNSTATVFDIGSIPIDFTRAAILKLVDKGQISYEDPITKFIKNVPEDKTGITIGHLMNDESGLPNFHDIEGVDEDFDLSWITRDEAIRRMMSSPLLAKPGTEYLPSHSGYGLLAAIVEIVSDETYEDFLQKHFFKPMGMKNIGPYGKGSEISPELMAVGYGKQATKPNIPTEWGKTSWLIKGSGGMVSTTEDLYTWNRELQKGKYLSRESKERFGFGNASFGGTERGFLTCYRRDGSDTVIVCSNASQQDYPGRMKLFRSLLHLVSDQ